MEAVLKRHFSVSINVHIFSEGSCCVTYLLTMPLTTNSSQCKHNNSAIYSAVSWCRAQILTVCGQHCSVCVSFVADFKQWISWYGFLVFFWPRWLLLMVSLQIKPTLWVKLSCWICMYVLTVQQNTVGTCFSLTKTTACIACKLVY